MDYSKKNSKRLIPDYTNNDIEIISITNQRWFQFKTQKNNPKKKNEENEAEIDVVTYIIFVGNCFTRTIFTFMQKLN